MSTPAPALLPLPGGPKDVAEARELAEEIRVGLDHMRHMSHDELHNLVQSRIRMLNGVLTEREQRHQAFETARLANGVLECRRDSVRNMMRHIDTFGAAAAAASLAFVFARL